MAAPSMVTVMCVGIKCALFDTKSTTIITALCLEDLGSSTMKSVLKVSHHVSGTGRGCSLPTGGCCMGFVLKHRLHMLTYCPMYWDI